GFAGEEKTDFNQSYRTDKSVRNTVVFYYNNSTAPGVRADQASGLALLKQVTYKGDVIATPANMNDSNIRSVTFLAGFEGEEKQWYTNNFGSLGATTSPKHTSVYYYGSDYLGADELTADQASDAALVWVIQYKGGTSTFQTSTFFKGDVGE